MGRHKRSAAGSRRGAAGASIAAQSAPRHAQLAPLVLGAAVVAAAAMLVLQPQPALGFTRPDQRESAWQGWCWDSGVWAHTGWLCGRYLGVTRARPRSPTRRRPTHHAAAALYPVCLLAKVC